jgi:hypothetical protein
MRIELSAIEELSGTAVVSSCGLTRRISISPGSVVDSGATGQMVEQVRQTLSDVAAPFPDEPVGRGARWQKLSQLASKDRRITQTDTFTLVELAADHGAVDDVLAQTAPAQPLVAPGQPPGEETRLESALTSGGDKTRFDFTRLIPQRTFDGTSTMVVSGQSPGESSRRITIIMRLGIVVTGAVR